MQLHFALLFDVFRVFLSICFIDELVNVRVSVTACVFIWSGLLCIVSYHLLSVMFYAMLYLVDIFRNMKGNEVEDSAHA